MKQTITPEQLNELSEVQIKTFLDWVLSKLEEVDRSVINNMALELDENSANGLYIEHITIGIMIEFLNEKYKLNIYCDDKVWVIMRLRTDDFGEVDKKVLSSSIELCDCLWEAVKHELSRVGE